MSIRYNRQDALLTATVTVPTHGNDENTSAATIDTGFEGSIDECQLVVEMPAIGSGGTVTLTVLSSDTPEGEFTATSAVFAASNKDAAAEYRCRMPLDAKRYIKLKAATGSTAPSAAIVAKLTLRV